MVVPTSSINRPIPIALCCCKSALRKLSGQVTKANFRDSTTLIPNYNNKTRVSRGPKLFVPERNYWIDAAGAAGGDPCGNEGYHREEQRDGDKS